jgi:predicted CoA-binding protein
MIVEHDNDLRRILAEPCSVAVLGAKSEPHEAAWYVPAYLRDRSWTVVGVNPKLAGAHWLGNTAVASLADLAPVDVLEVFRRPEALPGHVAEILRLAWRPRVVWLQLGIRHDEAARALSDAGIDVVQDRCMMPEHRRLVGGR